jgi:hypothetical protein
VLGALLAASTAHASDVDILFPLNGLFFGLVLVVVLLPTIPMAPVAALAGLYALLGERRLALGLGTLLVNSISLAGIAVLFMGLKSHDSSNNLEAIAAIVLPVPLTAMLLWHGMIRHWTSSKKGTAAFMAFVIGGTLFVGEIAYWVISTAPPPPVLDAGYAARRCHRSVRVRCFPFDTWTDQKVDECVAATPVCKTSQPWEEPDECCAATCLAAYAEERASPSPARTALEVAFDTTHECHPGVQEGFRARGYEPPPIRGRKSTPRVQLGAVPPVPTPSPRPE